MRLDRTVPMCFPGMFFVLCFFYIDFVCQKEIRDFDSFLYQMALFTHTIVFIFWCCVLLLHHATMNCILFARKRVSCHS